MSVEVTIISKQLIREALLNRLTAADQELVAQTITADPRARSVAEHLSREIAQAEMALPSAMRTNGRLAHLLRTWAPTTCQ